MVKCQRSNYLLVASIVIILLTSSLAKGQLSPPGLDGARAVSWGAVGVSQQYAKKWMTTAYIGGSLQSDPTNFSILRKPAIFVVNQETSYVFDKRWSLAAGISLRFQELYHDEQPYDPQNPAWRKETRYYARLFYKITGASVNYVLSFRPELREFYTTHGQRWKSPAQQRYRFKGQMNIPLNSSGTNIIVIADEWLFASGEAASGTWENLRFTENRLSTYFRHVFAKPALFLNAGLMHQFWEDNYRHVKYTTYFSIDLLFRNPLSK